MTKRNLASLMRGRKSLGHFRFMLANDFTVLLTTSNDLLAKGRYSDLGYAVAELRSKNSCPIA
jgi:hypothetical protein